MEAVTMAPAFAAHASEPVATSSTSAADFSLPTDAAPVSVAGTPPQAPAAPTFERNVPIARTELSADGDLVPSSGRRPPKAVDAVVSGPASDHRQEGDEEPALALLLAVLTALPLAAPRATPPPSAEPANNSLPPAPSLQSTTIALASSDAGRTPGGPTLGDERGAVLEAASTIEAAPTVMAAPPAQEMRTPASTPSAALQAVPPPVDAREPWVEAMATRLVEAVRSPDVAPLRVRLAPAHLGEVELVIDAQDAVAPRVQIVTATPAAEQLMKDHRGELSDEARRHGTAFASIDVALGQQGGRERSSQGGSPAPHPPPAPRPDPRRPARDGPSTRSPRLTHDRYA